MVEVRRGRGGRGGGGGEAAGVDIKSNNPHLAGGEKTENLREKRKRFRPSLLQIFHEANWQLILQRALATRGGAATATGPDGWRWMSQMFVF